MTPLRPWRLARGSRRTTQKTKLSYMCYVEPFEFVRHFAFRVGPNGPNASAVSVRQVARSGGNVRQPNHLANEIAGHKAERRSGAGEEWLAATKDDGAEVKSILINKTKRG